MPETVEVKTGVKEVIIDQLGVDEEKITPESDIILDLGADSLDVIEIIMAFEEIFNIDIPEKEAKKLRTVQNFVDHIKEQTE